MLESVENDKQTVQKDRISCYRPGVSGQEKEFAIIKSDPLAFNDTEIVSVILKCYDYAAHRYITKNENI